MIHTDFYTGFIKAEVISYDNFVEYQDKAKEQGVMKIEGKEYLVEDADVMHFKFHNTSKKK